MSKWSFGGGIKLFTVEFACKTTSDVLDMVVDDRRLSRNHLIPDTVNEVEFLTKVSLLLMLETQFGSWECQTRCALIRCKKDWQGPYLECDHGPAFRSKQPMQRVGQSYRS